MSHWQQRGHFLRLVRTKPDCDRCTGSLYYLQGLCTNANRRCSSVILRDTMTLHAMRAATYNPLQDHTKLASGRMVPRLLKQGRVIQVANDTQASATRRHVVNLHPLVSYPVGIHCVPVVPVICISHQISSWRRHARCPFQPYLRPAPCATRRHVLRLACC